MLTTTATIAFLLVASSLAALAIHEGLGSGSLRHRRRRVDDVPMASLQVVDRLEEDLRDELHAVQRQLDEGQTALAEDSNPLEGPVALGEDGESVRADVEALRSSLQGLHTYSEQLGEWVQHQGQSFMEAGAQHEAAIAASANEARNAHGALQEELDQLGRTVAGLSAQVVNAERTIDIDRIASIEANVQGLQAHGEAKRISDLEQLVMELMDKVEEQPSLTEFESRLAGCESQCADFAASQVSADRLAQLEQSFYSQDLRLCTLEDDLADASPRGKRSLLPSEPEPIGPFNRDDLKQIKGIGTVLEQTLNSLGIQRLEQVANLSVDQLEELSEELGAFASRIERDRWIEQARRLVQR